MNHEHRYLNQKGENQYKYKIRHQLKNCLRTTEISIKTLKNCKQIKYQLIREEKPIKYKTINKFHPEHAQVDTPKINEKQSSNGFNLLNSGNKLSHDIRKLY